jgi:hypothetical protein
MFEVIIMKTVVKKLALLILIVASLRINLSGNYAIPAVLVPRV